MSAAKKAGDVAVWAILVLLVVGLVGFGATNFGGNVQSIGKVGNTPITVNDYFRTLQQNISAVSAQFNTRLSLPQAEAFGVVAQSREQVISDATLDNTAAILGVSVGDEEVRRQILNTPGFTGLDGEFDREGYRFALEQNGMTEREFEASLRQDAARGILQSAIVAGIVSPQSHANTLMNYVAETRSFATITLSVDDLAEAVEAPDAAALQAFYDANPDAFTLPQSRQITYAWLTPDMIIDEMQVDEARLRETYEERSDFYNRPERRLVERLIYPDQAAADAARAQLDSGDADFEGLVQARGLDLTDIDLGDVTAQSLGGAAAEAVFALTEPGVVGPVDTDLGPAFFRMNAILAAQNTTFDEAREALQVELARDAAVRAIADQLGDFDDQLAAGATLEELTAETDMQLGQISYFDGQDEGIAGYAAFRASAAAVLESDFPELADLDDGGLFALRLDGITEPTLQPLNDVRDAATTLWQAEETRAQLLAQADELAAKITGGAAIDTLGYTVELTESLTRDAVTPDALSDAVFALAEAGDTVTLQQGDTAILAVLNEVQAADMADAQVVLQSTFLASQLSQGISQDIYTQLSQALLAEAGLELDQAAIAAVHAQFHQ
ncbi:hypothetical protein ACMU_17625 [Actibacterium mucosum KCTC 23349]|uniref:Parvulin-like PPIase n=1 Tax=Actibacterium mucosum KCTC 23349 TaxID=1454373 RepID=A0A037ZFZ0_9RHOB|nr:peptidyl-prolyl cis-trans isomerase [Actibacterium mucosum]KAJ54528.1 hypothetical protein ACMU_17625 [Actibacterium mucosum KCTC 23349]